jgi:hypothetical protein
VEAALDKVGSTVVRLVGDGGEPALPAPPRRRVVLAHARSARSCAAPPFTFAIDLGPDFVGAADIEVVRLAYFRVERQEELPEQTAGRWCLIRLNLMGPVRETCGGRIPDRCSTTIWWTMGASILGAGSAYQFIGLAAQTSPPRTASHFKRSASEWSPISREPAARSH